MFQVSTSVLPKAVMNVTVGPVPYDAKLFILMLLQHLMKSHGSALTESYFWLLYSSWYKKCTAVCNTRTREMKTSLLCLLLMVVVACAAPEGGGRNEDLIHVAKADVDGEFQEERFHCYPYPCTGTNGELQGTTGSTACSGVAWCDVAWCDVAWCDVAWCDVACCGVACCGVACCGVPCCDVACSGVACCGAACCGVVCCGVPCCDVVCSGVACCGVAYGDITYCDRAGVNKWGIFCY
ncbi:hypothetical protein FHG87_009207 [Trinorchestia longiramus]|nr:hypothetical protein FHG87_009207 [Trinorchestia longiramus]